MRLLGDRSLAFVLSNARESANYRALVRAFRVYRRPAGALLRYLTGRGRYPARLAVRTPAGEVAPELHSHHDLLTVNEVFCREDYRCEGDERLIVDIGSNIGISALYFLTAAPRARCLLYEPDPRNAQRLRDNLAGWGERWELRESAVADREGELPFWTDPFGRYGSLRPLEGRPAIAVEVVHINDVLEDALREARAVDLLKIDTEGTEAATVAAIRPDLLARVRRIYYEATDGEVVVPEGFEASVACDTVRLDNARLGPEGRGSLR
jgi:FkbM family methyltransferase